MELNTLYKIDNTPVVATQRILTMSAAEVGKVRVFEKELLEFQQMVIPTSHIFHGGMYSRTIMVPAGVILTGSLMKIATLLIIQGDFLLYAGEDAIKLSGYNVFAGGANRKQSGVALDDTWVTMIFPSNAKTVEDAEKQFTDEYEVLASRSPDAINHITITGE